MSTHKNDTGKFRTLGVDDTAKRRAFAPKKPSAFDPYKGAADKTPGRKRDLRKIDEWLKAKRVAEAAKRENEGSEE